MWRYARLGSHHFELFSGCTGVGLGPVVLAPENLTVRIGEEAELLLRASSGSLGNLRYEGNLYLYPQWGDSLLLVEHQTRDTWDTWGSWVEELGLGLEYYVQRAPSDPGDYLGYLEAGGVRAQRTLSSA